MKRKLVTGCFMIFIILTPCCAQWVHGETRTGFFLSMGQMHYSFKSYSDDHTPVTLGEPSDMFFGLSLYFNSQWEATLFYNRSSEDFAQDPNVVTYDKDGFGLEAGKIIPIHLFKKGSFDVSLHISGGGYYLIYPFKKKKSGSVVQYENLDDGAMFFQAGFYWHIRLKYMIAGKASFDIGFKSLIPFSGNEYKATRGKDILVTKSFFTIGVSF